MLFRSEIDKDNERYNLIKLKIINEKELVQYKIKWVLGYEFFQTSCDIIPGGNKEIILLNKNYFMMGDFFDLTILEIK